jgi:hypothetical protein
MQVVRLTKFDYRLANRLDSDLQKLRCRVNYHALRFTDPIQEMGEKIIQRMRERSTHFIALHLRCSQFKFSLPQSEIKLTDICHIRLSTLCVCETHSWYEVRFSLKHTDCLNLSRDEQ